MLASMFYKLRLRLQLTFCICVAITWLTAALVTRRCCLTFLWSSPFPQTTSPPPPPPPPSPFFHTKELLLIIFFCLSPYCMHTNFYHLHYLVFCWFLEANSKLRYRYVFVSSMINDSKHYEASSTSQNKKMKRQKMPTGKMKDFLLPVLGLWKDINPSLKRGKFASWLWVKLKTMWLFTLDTGPFLTSQ